MHRLRDLSRRQRVVAAVLVVLVLVPFGASFGRAVHHHWIPSGDDALIGLRSYDVLTEHRPLVGQPSTSHLYGPEEGTAHPGPIEFYWLAAPLRLFGPATGMLLGSLVVNGGSVLVAAWVVLRRAGPAAAGWALVLLGALLWSEGTALLTDPISSNAGGVPLLALAALTWAVVDGDRRLLPLAALVGSWVAQQHLAIVAPAAALVGWAVVGVTVGLVVRWRRARHEAAVVEPARPTQTVADDDDIWTDPVRPEPLAPTPEAPDGRVWPWLLGALVVALVCWAPVIYQQATGHPGNITAVLEYAQTSETPKLGWGDGFRQAVRAVGFPPLLVRSDLTGTDFFPGPLGIAEVVVALATYLALAATTVLAWRTRRNLALLAATALALTAGGIYNGKTIPASIESFRINFYRWTYVVAWLSWIVLGWLGVLAVQALWARRTTGPPPVQARLARVAPGLAAVALLVPAVASVATAGYNDARRDQAGFRAMEQTSEAALDAAEGHHRVTLVLRGAAAATSFGPALTLQLTAAGHEVLVPGAESRFYGAHRILRPGDDPGLVLELISARGAVPDGPGRALETVELNPEIGELLVPMAQRFRDTPPVVSPEGPAILADDQADPAVRELVRQALDQARTDPVAVVRDPGLLRLIAEGYFSAPAIDPVDARRLADLLPGAVVWNDDVFEVRLLTRAELGAEVPDWAEG